MSTAPKPHAMRHGQANTARPTLLAAHLSEVFTRPGGRAPPHASLFEPPPASRRRDRLWELSPTLHCSIIGTCLSTTDLRALLGKLGDPRAGTASEHDLHGQAVSRAARKDEGGKLLHKLLDRRHAGEIAKFERARDLDAVRDLWREAMAGGRIPGAYWAVLTHALTDHALVQEAFGEVHMLSHLVGRSVRADLRRLAELDAQVDAQADALDEQQSRIQALTDEKAALAKEVAEARSRPSSHPVSGPEALSEVLRRRDAVIARLEEQVGRADAHAAAESERRSEAERALRALAGEIRQGAEREGVLRAERDGLEAAMTSALGDGSEGVTLALQGRTLLYVGGRPQQVAQARLFVRQRGGHLLTHDGGVDDNPLLLPGLVGRAYAVLFPVDCVSHDAAGTLKRSCRDTDIPFVPLRTASLAALATALASLR